MTGQRRRRRQDERAVRIGDVAAAAGVSTATVSRTLSAPDQVRADTRDKVMEAVRRLGYTRNAAARNLRAGTSMLVLVVVPKMANPVFIDVVRGVDETLSARGYGIIIGDLDNVIEKERHLVDLVSAGHLDGAVIMSGRVPRARGRSIFGAGVPLVGACCRLDQGSVPAVLINDHDACATMTRHLIGLGHRDLLYIAGPEGNYNETTRYAGFLEAAAAAGLPPERLQRHPGRFTFDSGVEAAHRFLAEGCRQTGVVASNDETAIGFIRTITAAGIRVPEDVSVVGFDDIEFSRYIDPPLTTIRQPLRQMGAMAADLLLKAFDGEVLGESDSIIVPGELVVRASTGPAPARGEGGDRDRRPAPATAQTQ